ncbi:MAG: hypothetical protein AB2A00_41050 [Myxococcota bacterium]
MPELLARSTLWRMVRGCVWLLLALLACQPEGSLGPMQVCSTGAFDSQAVRCTTDEAGTPIQSGEVFCTVEVRNQAGRNATGRFFYLDEEVSVSRTVVEAGASAVAFRFARVGLQALPGGAWRCEITVDDDVASVDFESAASAGPLLDLAACPGSETVGGGGVPICTRDLSSEGWPRTDQLTCSASVAGAKGCHVSTELHLGNQTVARSDGVDAAAQLVAYAKGFSNGASGGFAAGDYRCVFLLDGQAAGERAFTLREP